MSIAAVLIGLAILGITVTIGAYVAAYAIQSLWGDSEE